MKFFTLFPITTIIFACGGVCLSSACDDGDCMASLPLSTNKGNIKNFNETCTEVSKAITHSLDLKRKFPEDLTVEEENAENNKLNEKSINKNMKNSKDNLIARGKSYGANPAAKTSRTKPEPVFNVSFPYVVFCILTGGLVGWVLIEWFDDPEDDDEDEFNTAPDADESIGAIKCSTKKIGSLDTLTNKLKLTGNNVTFRSDISSTTGNVSFEDIEEDVNC